MYNKIIFLTILCLIIFLNLSACNLGKDYEIDKKTDSNNIALADINRNSDYNWKKAANFKFNTTNPADFLLDTVTDKELVVPKYGYEPWMIDGIWSDGGCAEFFYSHLDAQNRDDLKFRDNTSFKIKFKAFLYRAYDNDEDRDVFIGHYNGSGNPSWWIGMDRLGKNKGKAIFSLRGFNNNGALKSYRCVSNIKTMTDFRWHEIEAIYDDLKNTLNIKVDGKGCQLFELDGDDEIAITDKNGKPIVDDNGNKLKMDEIGSFKKYDNKDINIGYFINQGQYDYCGYLDELEIYTYKH